MRLIQNVPLCVGAVATIFDLKSVLLRVVDVVIPSVILPPLSGHIIDTTFQPAQTLNDLVPFRISTEDHASFLCNHFEERRGDAGLDGAILLLAPKNACIQL